MRVSIRFDTKFVWIWEDLKVGWAVVICYRFSHDFYKLYIRTWKCSPQCGTFWFAFYCSTKYCNNLYGDIFVFNFLFCSFIPTVWYILCFCFTFYVNIIFWWWTPVISIFQNTWIAKYKPPISSDLFCFSFRLTLWDIHFSFFCFMPLRF